MAPTFSEVALRACEEDKKLLKNTNILEAISENIRKTSPISSVFVQEITLETTPIAQTLLGLGCSGRKYHGESALGLATSEHRKEYVNLLTEAGADVNKGNDANSDVEIVGRTTPL